MNGLIKFRCWKLTEKCWIFSKSLFFELILMFKIQQLFVKKGFDFFSAGPHSTGKKVFDFEKKTFCCVIIYFLGLCGFQLCAELHRLYREFILFKINLVKKLILIILYVSKRITNERKNQYLKNWGYDLLFLFLKATSERGKRLKIIEDLGPSLNFALSDVTYF